MKQLFLILLFASLNFAQSEVILLMGDDIDLNKYAIDVSETEYGIKTSPANIDLNKQKFTILAWVKTPASLSGYHMFLNTHFNAGSPGWWLGLDGNKISLATNWGLGNAFGTISSVQANTWYFIAIVCTTTTQAATDYVCYVDNNLEVITAGAGETVSNTNPLIVGGYWDNGFALNWTSQIGEIQIIKGHNLSTTEMTAAFTGGLKASYSAGTVVAWYKWSGATDAVMLNDYSASGNDLTGNGLTTADQVKIGAVYK